MKEKLLAYFEFASTSVLSGSVIISYGQDDVKKKIKG